MKMFNHKNSRMKSGGLHLLFISSVFMIISCEEPDKTNQVVEEELANTLETADLGGRTGYISDYFYDFASNINVDFYRFSSSYFTFDYDQYLNLLQDTPPNLNVRSFPEYLVEITPTQHEYAERTLIDSLTITDVVESNSILILSTQFKNVESLVWDTDAEPQAQRYKPNNSDWIFDTTTVTYSDTMDVIAYRAVVDTPMIDEGVLFIDQAEWVDTTYEYVADERLEFSHVFSFQRKQLNGDSLIFRVNTDCNDNGSWDSAETADIGNGIWDPAEPFYDLDGDNVKDASEPFEDRNCNEVWDAAEAFVDANSNGQYDAGEDFVDSENGIIDGAEEYTDLDGDEQPGANELFIFNPIPNNLLVTWADPQNPQVIDVIETGDSLVTRWGIIYYDIIEEIVFEDHKTVTATDKDSLVTLFTNRVIGHIVGGEGQDDYFIVKTEWEDDNTEGKDYDYLLFKQFEHIYKLVKPSFFKPYGYYWSEGQMASGFWFKNEFEDEVVYYTSNGLLREGERVETMYYDSTNVAIYRVERSFQVDVEDVTVPAAQVRGFINNDDEIECYANAAWTADTIDDCPGADTTFTDAFKITNILTQTMIGTDVEYGEKSISWLVKDYGIVKDELHIRWTERPDAKEEIWLGISRWELGRFSATSSGGGQFAKLLKRAHIVKINELQNIPELEDPFQIKRTAGLQRVELPR